MLDFFDYIIDMFQMLFDFILNLINSIITLLVVVAQAITIPPLLAGYAPAVLGTCILAVSAIGIAKLIAGWGNK